MVTIETSPEAPVGVRLQSADLTVALDVLRGEVSANPQTRRTPDDACWPDCDPARQRHCTGRICCPHLWRTKEGK